MDLFEEAGGKLPRELFLTYVQILCKISNISMSAIGCCIHTKIPLKPQIKVNDTEISLSYEDIAQIARLFSMVHSFKAFHVNTVLDDGGNIECKLGLVKRLDADYNTQSFQKCDLVTQLSLANELLIEILAPYFESQQKQLTDEQTKVPTKQACTPLMQKTMHPEQLTNGSILRFCYYDMLKERFKLKPIYQSERPDIPSHISLQLHTMPPNRCKYMEKIFNQINQSLEQEIDAAQLQGCIQLYYILCTSNDDVFNGFYQQFAPSSHGNHFTAIVTELMDYALKLYVKQHRLNSSSQFKKKKFEEFVGRLTNQRCQGWNVDPFIPLNIPKNSGIIEKQFCTWLFTGEKSITVFT